MYPVYQLILCLKIFIINLKLFPMLLLRSRRSLGNPVFSLSCVNNVLKTVILVFK